MRAKRTLSTGRAALMVGAAGAALLLAGMAWIATASLAGPLVSRLSSHAVGGPSLMRVVPRLSVPSARGGAPARVIAPVNPPAPAPAFDQQQLAPSVQSSTSADWAGYATTGTTYTSVAGSWTQPRPTCQAGETAYSAYWLGIDGDNSTTVEQIGTESDCAQGTPSYAAWYELFPAAPTPIQHTVAAGDAISASVTGTTADAFTFKLNDTTQHWTFTTTATVPSAQRSSAEWIAEAPSNGRRSLPLADFGTVTFTACSANGQALSADPNLDAITLTTRQGVALAKPSSISSAGTGFSITAQPGATSASGGGAPFPTGPHRGHHRRHRRGGGGSSPVSGGNPYPGPGNPYDGSGGWGGGAGPQW